MYAYCHFCEGIVPLTVLDDGYAHWYGYQHEERVVCSECLSTRLTEPTSGEPLAIDTGTLKKLLAKEEI